MITDDFEQRLQRVPLRPAPPEWRRESLSAARQSAPAPQAVSPANAMARWPAWLWRSLWPCPQAWAGLAALWVVVAVLNVTLRDDSASRATLAPTPSSHLVMGFSEQQRLLAELIGNAEPILPPPPKVPAPRPHAERRSILLMA